MTTVHMAVISGGKFAQPNGMGLKYENVSFTLSVGDKANIQTAPNGNVSNTIAKAGKTTKLIFFMLYPPSQISERGSKGAGPGPKQFHSSI